MEFTVRRQQMRILTLAFAILLWSLPAAAQDPHAVQVILDTLPETRNSPLVAAPASVKHSPFSGGASYEYTFDIPPGTGASTPQLALAYSSLSGNGPYGYGWNLSLGVIERSTRQGTPTYTIFDRFELDGELISPDPYNAGRFYRRHNDSFALIEFDGSYWTVTETDGTRRRYGVAATSRLTNPSGQVFRWALDEFIDPRGNKFVVHYTQDLENGQVVQLYPDRIRYSFRESGSSTLQQEARWVTFDWADERRNHSGEDMDRPTSYRAGFLVRTRKRLREVRAGIDENTNGVFEESEYDFVYKLAYAPKTRQSPPSLALQSPFSKLVSIHRIGRNGAEFPSQTTFGYSEPQRAFQSTFPLDNGALSSNWIRWSVQHGNPQYVKTFTGLYDMDGDGIPDRVYAAPGNQWEINRGVYTGPASNRQFSYESTNTLWKWCDAACGCNNTHPGSAIHELDLTEDFDFRRRVADLIDMNGDGLPDRVEVTGAPNAETWSVRLNLANDDSCPVLGFGPSIPWTGPNLATADIWEGSKAISRTDIDGSLYSPVSGAVLRDTQQVARMIDINADGRPDHVTFNRNDDFELFVSYNQGCDPVCGFANPVPIDGGFPFNSGGPSQNIGAAYGDSAGSSTVAEIADVNADGVPDFLYSDLVAGDSNSGSSCVSVGYGLGNGFQRYSGVESTGFIGGEQHCATATGGIGFLPYGPLMREQLGVTFKTILDMNGDGVVDRVAFAGNELRVRFGLGDGSFTSEPVSWGGGIGIRSRNVSITDINGDGLADWAQCPGNSQSCDSSTWNVGWHPGAPGLLTEVKNELGGVTTLQYASSAQFVGLSAAIPQDPAPQNAQKLRSHSFVVARITTKDGRNDSTEEQVFTYAESRYSDELRETLGFRMVDADDRNGASTIARTRSHFHQDIERRGKLESEAIIPGGSGPALQIRTTDWTAEPTRNPSGNIVPDSYFAGPEKEITAVNGQFHIVDRDFNLTTGQVTVEADWGPDATYDTEDDLERKFFYPQNPVGNLLAYPDRVEEFHGNSLVGTTEYAYDTLGYGQAPWQGKLTGRKRTFDGQVTEESWTYEPAGNAETYHDGRGNRVFLASYDASKTFVTSVQDAENLIRQFEHDEGMGEVLKARDPNGYLQCWEYDDFGRLMRYAESTTPQSIGGSCPATLSRFEFVSVGHAGSQHILEKYYTECDPLIDSGCSGEIHASRRYLDGLGREYQVERQARTSRNGGNDFFVTVKGYGPRGELTCESLQVRGTAQARRCASISPRRTRTYDALLRPLSVSLGGVTEESRTYSGGEDLDGEPGTEVIERLTIHPGRVLRIARNPRGAVVAIEEESGFNEPLTVYKRDPRDRVTEIDGPLPALTDWMKIEYDFLGRRKQLQLPGTYKKTGSGCSTGSVCDLLDAASLRSWHFGWDANGNLESQISPTGRTVNFVYDANNRLKRKEPQGAGEAPTVYEYDEGTSVYSQGRLSSVTTGTVDTQYDYDLNGNIDTTTRAFLNTAPPLNFTFEYEYDRLGRRTEIEYPDGFLVQPQYDGSVTSEILEGPTGNLTAIANTISLHESGQLASISFPRGPSTSIINYDGSDHRPDDIRTWVGGRVAQYIDLEFNTAGNLTTYNYDGWRGSERHSTFTYDGQHRLWTMTGSYRRNSFSDRNDWNHTYSYDEGGNLTGIDFGISSWNMEYECSPGGPQALTKITASTGALVSKYEYDKDGYVKKRTVGSQTHRLNRNSEGQIINIAKGSEQTCIAYDHDGRRVAVKPRQNTKDWEVTRYHASPEYEVDNTSGSHTIHVFLDGRRVASVRRNGVGNDGSATSQEPAFYRFYHPDHLGTNVLTSEPGGVVTQETFHNPYGQIHQSKRPLNRNDTRYLYAGSEFDPGTELLYMQARYYDPLAGSFMSPDPAMVGGKPGESFGLLDQEPQHYNLYAYALNRPTTVVDPSGRTSFDVLQGLEAAKTQIRPKQTEIRNAPPRGGRSVGPNRSALSQSEAGKSLKSGGDALGKAALIGKAASKLVPGGAGKAMGKVADKVGEAADYASGLGSQVDDSRDLDGSTAAEDLGTLSTLAGLASRLVPGLGQVATALGIGSLVVENADAISDAASDLSDATGATEFGRQAGQTLTSPTAFENLVTGR